MSSPSGPGQWTGAAPSCWTCSCSARPTRRPCARRRPMADWSLPQRMAVVTLPLDRAAGLRLRLGPGTLVDRAGDRRRRPGAGAEVRAARRGPGPCPAGARRFRGTGRRLGEGSRIRCGWPCWRPRHCLRGTGPEEPPIWADEHLAQVILGAEPSAIAELANRRLAPLEGLRPAQRERLAETLLSWLRHWGQRAPGGGRARDPPADRGLPGRAAARAFRRRPGGPEARFELELALHAGRR